MAACRRRWDDISKPLSSLGRLEDMITTAAGIAGTPDVSLSHPVICVMCADNGVVSQGVTQTGSGVTASVCSSIAAGRGCVCLMGRRIGAAAVPVDIGVGRDMEPQGSLVIKKVMRGTNDISLGPAMSRAQAARAILVGVDMCRAFKEQGFDILITGEMSIGNTTTAAAVASALLDLPARRAAGRGAGLSDAALKRKIAVIEQAIAVNRPDPRDPLDVLSKVGGLDIAGMTGLFIGAAAYRLPVVIDGFISSVAALCAKLLAPACRDFMLPSHVSAEPAGAAVLEALGMNGIIDCGMFLGEGTGAVGAVALMQLALEVYRSMQTFEQANIEKYVKQN